MDCTLKSDESQSNGPYDVILLPTQLGEESSQEECGHTTKQIQANEQGNFIKIKLTPNQLTLQSNNNQMLEKFVQKGGTSLLQSVNDSVKSLPKFENNIQTNAKEKFGQTYCQVVQGSGEGREQKSEQDGNVNDNDGADKIIMKSKECNIVVSSSVLSKFIQLGGMTLIQKMQEYDELLAKKVDNQDNHPVDVVSKQEETGFKVNEDTTYTKVTLKEFANAVQAGFATNLLVEISEKDYSSSKDFFNEQGNCMIILQNSTTIIKYLKISNKYSKCKYIMFNTQNVAIIENVCISGIQLIVARNTNLTKQGQFVKLNNIQVLNSELTGIYLHDCGHVQLQNIIISNSLQQHGIYCHHCDNVIAQNIIVRNCKLDGLRILGATVSIVEQVDIRNCQQYGVCFLNVGNGMLRNHVTQVSGIKNSVRIEKSNVAIYEDENFIKDCGFFDTADK